jgi:hypothetical protein
MFSTGVELEVRSYKVRDRALAAAQIAVATVRRTFHGHHLSGAVVIRRALVLVVFLPVGITHVAQFTALRRLLHPLVGVDGYFHTAIQ